MPSLQLREAQASDVDVLTNFNQDMAKVRLRTPRAAVPLVCHSAASAIRVAGNGGGRIINGHLEGKHVSSYKPQGEYRLIWHTLDRAVLQAGISSVIHDSTKGTYHVGEVRTCSRMALNLARRPVSEILRCVLPAARSSCRCPSDHIRVE